MKQRILIVGFWVWCLAGLAQRPVVKQWDMRYGGAAYEKLGALIQTADGGYVVGGWSNSDSTGDRTEHTRGLYDYWFVKTDSLGNKQWDKRYGGGNTDQLNVLQQTRDHGFIMGGESGSDIGGDKTQPLWGASDYWIVKTDSLGQKQWDKRFGGTRHEALYDLQQTTDGGYILGGISHSDSSGDKTQRNWDPHTSFFDGPDYWIVKIDSAGNKQWDKRFGGTGDDYFTSLQQTADGGYILGGSSVSGIGGDKTQPCYSLFNDFWIVKIDANGIKQWDKRFGGSKNEGLAHVKQTPDHGYILAGFSNSPIDGDKTQDDLDTSYLYSDFWLVKTDSLGNKQWDKRLGGSNQEDDMGSFELTADGGYLIGGTSYSDDGDKTEANPAGATEQTWILKLDSAGNRQWDKTIFTNAHDESGMVITTADGCYAIANYTTAAIGGYKTQTSRGYEDYWLVKFCDTALCNLSSPTVQASQSIFCSGDSAQVCAISSAGSYLWNTGETTSCIYASHAGNYYVTVTGANNCSAVSNHLPVYVYPVPPVSITVTGNTLTSFNGVTYQWYLNDTAISGATDSIYVAGQTGNYTVEISDSNGCHTFSNPVTVTISGMANLPIEQSIRLFPNPSNDFLVIESREEIMRLNIYDAMGEEVMAVSPGNGNCQLSTVNLAAGVYIAEIKMKDASVKRRWVKG